MKNSNLDRSVQLVLKSATFLLVCLVCFGSSATWAQTQIPDSPFGINDSRDFICQDGTQVLSYGWFQHAGDVPSGEITFRGARYFERGWNSFPRLDRSGGGDELSWTEWIKSNSQGKRFELVKSVVSPGQPETWFLRVTKRTEKGTDEVLSLSTCRELFSATKVRQAILANDLPALHTLTQNRPWWNFFPAGLAAAIYAERNLELLEFLIRTGKPMLGARFPLANSNNCLVSPLEAAASRQDRKLMLRLLDEGAPVGEELKLNLCLKGSMHLVFFAALHHELRLLDYGLRALPVLPRSSCILNLALSEASGLPTYRFIPELERRGLLSDWWKDHCRDYLIAESDGPLFPLFLALRRFDLDTVRRLLAVVPVTERIEFLNKHAQSLLLNAAMSGQTGPLEFLQNDLGVKLNVDPAFEQWRELPRSWAACSNTLPTFTPFWIRAQYPEEAKPCSKVQFLTVIRKLAEALAQNPDRDLFWLSMSTHLRGIDVIAQFFSEFPFQIEQEIFSLRSGYFGNYAAALISGEEVPKSPAWPDENRRVAALLKTLDDVSVRYPQITINSRLRARGADDGLPLIAYLAGFSSQNARGRRSFFEQVADWLQAHPEYQSALTSKGGQNARSICEKALNAADRAVCARL